MLNKVILEHLDVMDFSSIVCKWSDNISIEIKDVYEIEIILVLLFNYSFTFIIMKTTIYKKI